MERIGKPEGHKTVTELAQELGVDRRSVHRCIERLGIAAKLSWVQTAGGRQLGLTVDKAGAGLIRQWFSGG